MKMLSLLAIVLTLGLTLATGDADAARRLGGGKSMGMQKATPPAAAPSAAKAPAAAPAAAPAPGRSWMGPLAGLAAGLGLAALASHLGFGEGLANMMMIGLLIVAVIAVIGFVMRKRAAGQSPGLAGAGARAGASPLQYQSSGAPEAVPASRPFDVAMPPSSPAAPASAGTAPAGNIPADFDVAGFTRHAKVNFIRMQAANDAGNLEDIREFTTPEMFAELKMDIAERGAAKQETDVVSIDASVLDVAEEASRYVVSVRFAGVVRENNGGAEPVDEIWHLVKPRDGKTGWLLSGIQQPQ